MTPERHLTIAEVRETEMLTGCWDLVLRRGAGSPGPVDREDGSVVVPRDRTQVLPASKGPHIGHGLTRLHNMKCIEDTQAGAGLYGPQIHDAIYERVAI
jgi:hypothetical protein